MTHIYIVYAHPIGEDSEVFWMAAGTTREAAIHRLTEKVREGWFASDAELDADPDLGDQDRAEVRAERDGLDLENDEGWVLLVEGDFLA